MKIVEINTCNFGSTGNIMLQIAKTAEGRDHSVWFVCQNSALNRAKEVKNCFYIGNKLAFFLHTKLNLYTGLNGCGSLFATIKVLRKIKKIKPDLIQLHNLHNCYINLPLLFRFIKKNKLPVVWTLHDCWAFTGQCAHFDMLGCSKWKEGCHHCEQISVYPASYVDRTKTMWKLKRKWFCGVDNMTLVTPSAWLASCAKLSFLSEYPVQVINNGINLDVFNTSHGEVSKKYNLSDKKRTILGVSFGWGPKKGLDVFNELSRRLNPEQYQIILVGTDAKTDKLLDPSIVSIHKTNNQKELAQLYSFADVFVNPTREEALGLVNIEANACGTPVVTFNSGGSPECINKDSGVVVAKNDIDAMESEIIRICQQKPFSQADCQKNAQRFDMNIKFNEYIDLYERLYKISGTGRR